MVRDTLRRQVEALGGGPLRVLDVGGGDGRDAVPLAEAGHEVTVVDDALKHDPAYFAALERLELALCDREPYVRMGGMWQVVAEKRV